MAHPITSIVAITSGQEKQIVRFVADAAESAAKTAVTRVDFLDKDGAQSVIARGDELKIIIARATINALKQLSSGYRVLAETKLLKPVAKATIPARMKPFNTAAFYRTGAGLYVYDTFEDVLGLDVRQIVDSSPERSYVASLLKVTAYDTDIRKELPETHLSTLEDIAGLIEAQPNGKSGFLLNNGYANIFYVKGKNDKVLVVDARWFSVERRWRVFDWKLCVLGLWPIDYQVLCPGNAVL